MGQRELLLDRYGIGAGDLGYVLGRREAGVTAAGVPVPEVVDR